MPQVPVPLDAYPPRLQGLLADEEQVYKVLRPDGTVMFFQGLIVLPVYLSLLIVSLVALFALGTTRADFGAWWAAFSGSAVGGLVWIVPVVLAAMLALWVPYYYLTAFRRTLFVITARRVISLGGFTGRRFRFLPLEAVESVRVTRGFIDDLLDHGTGTVVVAGRGGARVDLGPLRNPQVVRDYVAAVGGEGRVHTLRDALQRQRAASDTAPASR